MAQSDWSLDRHTDKTEHAQTITHNASPSVHSTCIRPLFARNMGAPLPPLLLLQTDVFHTRRLFSSLPRAFLPCQSQGRKSWTSALNCNAAAERVTGMITELVLVPSNKTTAKTFPKNKWFDTECKLRKRRVDDANK